MTTERSVEEIRQFDVTKAVSYRRQLIGGKEAKVESRYSTGWVVIDRHAHLQRLTLADIIDKT